MNQAMVQRNVRRTWWSRLILMMWAMMALIGGLSSSSMVRAQDAPAPAPSAETGVAAEGAASTAPDAAVTTPSEAAADDALVMPLPADKLDTGDTAWVLASAALVLLMTPGLGFFYGGLVRSKNMLNTLLMSYGAMAVMALVWAFFAYSIAFGDGGALNNYFGGFQFAFLNGVGTDNAHSLAPTIPHQAFMVFQMMFFIITPALISGSLVERLKFSTYIVFICLWGLLIYAPVAHWVWGGGFIGAMGVKDFAGGAVVHVNAGFAALAGVMALGSRKGYNVQPWRPHNLPFCLLGVGLLWFGWYGFNAGSALGANGLATQAFVNTTLGAAAAMAAWMLIDQVTRKEMTALGAGTGAVAGLVGITPACGFVSPMGAILVGAITSGVCYIMATLRAKGPVDDSLDAFAVHGVGGFTGAVLTGIFAIDGGGLAQAGKQFLGTGIVAVYTFVGSFILFKVLNVVMGLRVHDEVEMRGLDIGLHGEEAYSEVAA